jgi:hypothetical protein
MKFNISNLFLLVFALLTAANTSLHAQANLTADSTHVEIGNPLILHFNVQGEKPERIDFTPWDSLVPPENRIKQTDWQKVGGFWKKDLTIMAFDSALLVLPSLDLIAASGAKQNTNDLQISVGFLPSIDPDLADIKGIHKEKTSWLDYWKYIAIVLLWGCIGFGLWWWKERKKPKSVVIERVIEIPAHEIALKKMEQLRNKQLPQKGELKEYYSELTFIFREYLEKRYQIPALESTTDEIIRDLRNTSFSKNAEKSLIEVLEWADMAKFAKATPPESFHDLAWQNTKAMIELMVPTENRVVSKI